MVARALVLGAAALPVAASAGFLAAGRGAALSAALGVTVVVLNFAAHGMSLAWAAGVSPTALQLVALGGFLVRMGIIFGALLVLDRSEFFSPLAFGLTVAAGILALLTYEARLVSRRLTRGVDAA
jgi:hypothetical protein